MPTDISGMQGFNVQDDKKKRLEELVNKGEETTKRTTVILEKEERDFIDKLIQEGKEPGIKPLISKMLNVYRSMMIYDWHFPGEYYCGISRIALVNVELLNILIQYIPKENKIYYSKSATIDITYSSPNTLVDFQDE